MVAETFPRGSDEAIEAVVKVNMFGVLICTKVAMELMLEQAGVGGSRIQHRRERCPERRHARLRDVWRGQTGPAADDGLTRSGTRGKTQGYNWPPSSPGQVKVHAVPGHGLYRFTVER